MADVAVDDMLRALSGVQDKQPLPLDQADTSRWSILPTSPNIQEQRSSIPWSVLLGERVNSPLQQTWHPKWPYIMPTDTIMSDPTIDQRKGQLATDAGINQVGASAMAEDERKKLWVMNRIRQERDAFQDQLNREYDKAHVTRSPLPPPR